MVTQLCELFGASIEDKEDKVAATTVVLSRAREIKSEMIELQAQNAQLQTVVDRSGSSADSAQETIARMAAQISDSQTSSNDQKREIADLNKHLIEAAAEKDRLGAEVAYLKSRLDSANAAWEAAKEETGGAAEEKEGLKTEVAELTHAKNLLESEINLFVGNMANMLSRPDQVIEATMDAVRERVKALYGTQDNSQRTIKILEQKLLEITQQLEKQCEIHTGTLRRAKRLESENSQDKSRFNRIEDDLAAASVLNSTLSNQRERFNAFLQDLADAMKVTSEDTTRDLELSTEMLLDRARQLGQLNTEELAEKSSGYYSIKRHLKTAKDQLRSKEMHIEMMRKKMNRLEIESGQRSSLAVDRDDAIVTLQKTQKKNDRMKVELANERQIILELKAKMSDVGELRASNMELIDQLEKAKTAVEKLSAIRDRQKTQIQELKDELKLSSHSADSERGTLQTHLQALTSDLQTTKKALDDAIAREKMLVEFREVVARMLGLDVSRLAVPDYEVVTRLERLIQNHHATNAGLHPGVPVNTALQDPNFQTGFMQVPVEVVATQQSSSQRPNNRPRRQRY